MRLFIILLAFKTLLCTCIFRSDEPSIKDKIAEADLILYAQAIADSGSKVYSDSSVFVEQITFEVKSILKGEAANKVRLKNSAKYCEASFRIGESYIIFAYKNPQSGIYETGSCQNVREWIKNDLEDANTLREARDFFGFVKNLIAKEVKR